MITLSFDDPKLVENVKAIQALQRSGMFSDEEIQTLYEDQLRRDKEADNEQS